MSEPVVVVLRKYASEIDANLHAAILEANGIPAQVMSDNAGGTLPSMSLLYPVRLMVREEDEQAAQEILDAPEAPARDADEP